MTTKTKSSQTGLSVPVVGKDGSPLGFSIKVDPLKVRGNTAQSLAAATIGWEPQIVLDGRNLPFSGENAAALYERLPFILRQIIEAIKKEQ